MRRYHRLPVWCAALVLMAACGGGRDEGRDRPEYTEAARRAEGGVVAPLTDDTSDDIMSWVDGKVVTEATPSKPRPSRRTSNAFPKPTAPANCLSRAS